MNRWSGAEPFFLRISLCALCVLCGALPLRAFGGESADVSISRTDTHLSVSIHNKPFTEYWFGPRSDRPYVRPFFSPVRAPDGTVVTSDEYLVKKSDHPHHQSLWVALGDVNGIDHWALHGEHSPVQKHLKFERVDDGSFVEDLDWEGSDGKPLMHERRTVSFEPLDARSNAIDFRLEFTAGDAPVTIGDTKEAGLVAVRVAHAISAHPTLTNSTGSRGEKAVWGKPADWVDESGTIDGKEYGIALFDNPSNPRAPTRWHAREYGLLAANPFGLSAFDKAPPHTGDFRIEPGKTVTWQFRVVIHEGDAAQNDLPAKYAGYAHSKTR